MAGRIVSLEEFKSLLKEIAAENPDFIYNKMDSEGKWPMCYYQPTVRHDGTTSRCIIGEALHRLGFDDISESDGPNAYQVLRDLGFDDATAMFAWKMQGYQDRGCSWSEAYLKTEERLRA